MSGTVSGVFVLDLFAVRVVLRALVRSGDEHRRRYSSADGDGQRQRDIVGRMRRCHTLR